VGADESVDVGHMKRKRYLAESPWAGEPAAIGEKVAMVTTFKLEVIALANASAITSE